MISFAIFIYSGNFHKLLNDSTYFQKLLKASIGVEKKILVNSGLLETSMIIHFKFLDD